MHAAGGTGGDEVARIPEKLQDSLLHMYELNPMYACAVWHLWALCTSVLV